MAGLVLAASLLAAPARAADPVVVAGGDVACAPEDSSFNGGAGIVSPPPGSCHEQYTSDLFPALAPAHILALGDLQYEDGNRARFDASYEPSWGRAKAITKPVPGNHEYGSGGSNVDPAAAGYFGYFAQQLAAEGPDAGNPQRGWYSFDVPVPTAPGAPPFNWHLVALNSECASGLRDRVGWTGRCDAGSEQEQWLRRDLAADASSCTIAYWHHPLFSSGGEGASPVMGPIWNALHDDYADLVLAGHDHDYERFPPRGAAPAGPVEPGRGIREFVVGTGGRSLLPPGAVDGTHEVFQNTVYGVLKLTLHAPSRAHLNGWYEWEFVDDGRSGSDFVEAGSADCVAPPDRTAPTVSRASVLRRRFRVGGGPTALVAKKKPPRGTVVRYSLSEFGTAMLRFDQGVKGRRVRVKNSRRRRCVAQTRRNAKRGNRRCTVYRKAATLTRSNALIGPQQVRFSARIGERKFRPGRYRLTITARDIPGNPAKPVALRFTVVK